MYHTFLLGITAIWGKQDLLRHEARRLFILKLMIIYVHEAGGYGKYDEGADIDLISKFSFPVDYFS